MDPRERDMLRKTFELVEENNEMLKKLRRTQKFGLVIKILYWVIVIGVAVGAYYFIQPFVDQIGQTYSGLQGNIDNATNVLDNLREILP
jgi:hypothetical protein